LRFFIWALIGLALTPSAWADSVVRFEQGKAWDPQKKRVLYTESHWTRYVGKAPVERTVLYQCSNGTPFARKEISYSLSALAPAFSFRDVRHDYQEGLRWQNGSPMVWHIKKGVRSDKPLSNKSNLVADAGFDEFIKLRWSTLTNEGRQTLNFALPSRLNSYGFKLQDTGNTLYRNEQAQAFSLGLEGLLGLIAPDIEVLYSKETRRLLRFKGISNIRDDSGKDQIDTLIEFPLRDTVVKPSEKTQAQSVMLKSCQVI
jgi:hypothetical protein